MTRVREALARIGGPAGISRATFPVVLVFTVGMQVSDAIDSFAPDQVPGRIAVILVPYAILCGVLLAGRRLFLRDVDRRPRPGRTLAVFAAAVVARGAAIGLLFPPLLGLPGNPGYRIAGSVLVLLPVLSATALIVDRARSRAIRRATLERAERRLEDAGRTADEEIRAAHARIVERVRTTLLAAVEDSAGAAPQAVVARLRAEVDEGIRPLSHRLARSMPTWFPALDAAAAGTVAWRELWRDMTLGRPFRPVLLGAILGLMTIPAATNRAGLAHGLAFAAVIAIALAALTLAAERCVGPLLARSGSATLRAALFLVTLVAVCGVSTAIASVAVVVVAPHVVAVPVIGPLVAVLIALAQALDTAVRRVEADLEASAIALDRAVVRVQQVAWQRQRVLALAIHGPLQARISAAALRLEQEIAAGTASVAAVDEALRSVVDALDEVDLSGQGQAGDLRVDLADVAEAWDGVCAVDVAVDEALARRIDDDPVSARVIVDVVTEACSNAVRHARARAVELRIDEDASGALRLLVRDDGRGGTARGDGLGTRLLDEVALSWDRRTTAGGTELTVLLPAPVA